MKVFNIIDGVMEKIDKVMAYIAATGLIFISGLTFVDVIFRYFLSQSLRGSQELVEMVMPIVVYGAMTLAVRRKKMISVEFVTEHLPLRARKIIETVMTALCAAAMAAVTVKLGDRVVYYLNGNYTSAVAKIPFTPFYIFTQLGCAIMTIEFLLNTIKSGMEAVKLFREKGGDR